MTWQNADDVATHLRERLQQEEELWGGDDLTAIAERVAQLYVMDPSDGGWRVDRSETEPTADAVQVFQVTRDGRPDPIYQTDEPERASRIADVLNEIEQLRKESGEEPANG